MPFKFMVFQMSTCTPYTGADTLHATIDAVQRVTPEFMLIESLTVFLHIGGGGGVASFLYLFSVPRGLS